MTPRGLLSILLFIANLPASASDWPWWRGPDRNGVAAADAAPPTDFGEEKGILWSVPIAGKVNWEIDVGATGAARWKGRLGGTFSASPVLVGDHIHAVNESGDYFIFKAIPRTHAR